MNRVRAATAEALLAQAQRRASAKVAYTGPVPRRMDLLTTPQEVLRAHDVYFNGVKQKLCTFACMDSKIIKRYVNGMGNIPIRGRDGLMATETLHGDVQIVRKGEPLGQS
jgi:hypothetical protein